MNRRWRAALLCFAAAVAMARPASPASLRAKPEAILYILRQPTPAEISYRNTRAKYEPETGCYLGGYIEFDKTIKKTVVDFDRKRRPDPRQFERRVGKPHAMYFFYVGYGRPIPFGWVRWLAAQGKFVHIALEPNDGLDHVKDDAYLRGLADGLAATKARIFLRFGSEMNGAWTNYHDPKRFKEKLRLVHAVMHRRAPNVALVWCPYATPVRNIPDFYPGDDAVDWVGVNMYSVIYHDNRLDSPCSAEHPNDLLATVYSRYAARKPMMICEFGASHFSQCDGRWRPDFAALKIATLYRSLPRIYPRVKAINYFDLSSDGVNNNYSVTDDPSILEAYRRATDSAYYISDARAAAHATGERIPFPVRKGEMMRGTVALSCFARGPSDRVAVRYTLDKTVIYRAAHPIDWPCAWNAGSVSPGRHTLGLEVYDERGRKVASESLSVQTAR